MREWPGSQKRLGAGIIWRLPYLHAENLGWFTNFMNLKVMLNWDFQLEHHHMALLCALGFLEHGVRALRESMRPWQKLA